MAGDCEGEVKIQFICVSDSAFDSIVHTDEIVVGGSGGNGWQRDESMGRKEDRAVKIVSFWDLGYKLH